MFVFFLTFSVYVVWRKPSGATSSTLGFELCWNKSHQILWNTKQLNTGCTFLCFLWRWKMCSVPWLLTQDRTDKQEVVWGFWTSTVLNHAAAFLYFSRINKNQREDRNGYSDDRPHSGRLEHSHAGCQMCKKNGQSSLQTLNRQVKWFDDLICLSQQNYSLN